MSKKPDSTWGGGWTQSKLDRLSGYLEAYMQIMSKNPRAQHFTKHYVDAFAGTGYSIVPGKETEHPDFLDEPADEASQKYIKGSAHRALDLETPFVRYFFVEQQSSKCEELEALAKAHPNLRDRITIEQGDANILIPEYLNQLNHDKDRVLMFIDPYGMQVQWELLQCIAKHPIVDMWLLFPLDGVNRMLAHGGVLDDKWRARLTAFFGTEEWEERFYAKDPQGDLFDGQQGLKREAGYDRIKEYFVERLSTIFDKRIAEPCILRRANGRVFLLCFAVSNRHRKAFAPALKIAEHLLQEDWEPKR